MPLTTVERPKQEWKIGAFGSASRTWHIFGTLDIEEVETEILSVAPTDWLSLGRDAANISIVELGYAAWACTVPYTRTAFIGGGGTPPASFSFRIGGKTEHIEHATVIASYGTSPPDHRGAINVDSKGRVAGADVPARGFTFEMEHWVDSDDMTNSYLGTLVSLCTKYNNASFRGFASGEVLYLGCNGSQDSGGRYKLSHQFEASPNITSGSVANGQITGVNKKGWEYIWVLWEDVVESNQPVKKAKAAYVHGWTTSGNFALLGVET